MHTLTSRLLVLALLAGCSTDSHEPGTGHDSTTGDPSTTHTHDGTTGTTGTIGETGHEHPTGTETSHAHSTGPEPGTTGGALTPAEAYCQCMVLDCHEEYHGTWGEDHEMSVTMCEAEAAALASVGMPATEGDSIECRMHYCELAHDDPTACASAIGGGSCI